MGSVRERSGKLQIDFRFQNVRCRENTGLADTSANRKKCEAALKRIEAEIVTGTFNYAAYFPNSKKVELFRSIDKRREVAHSHGPGFAEFAETWFKEKRPEWRRSYANTIRITLDKYLKPEFGEHAVSAIKKPDILAFRATLPDQPGISEGSNLSHARINKIMQPLRMIIEEAADRYKFDSPWTKITPLRQPKTQVDPFNINEVNLILAGVRPEMRTYYLTRFLTAMRSSEIDGLQWKYVDFERRQILVREALVQGKMEATKTDGSSRTIDMSKPVYDALLAHRAVSSRISDYVFCMSTGNPLINRNVTGRIWYPTLDRLGLRRRRPYQTRHTAATLWLASGENPEWIARQMGHSSTQMLFRIYSRFVPDLTRRDGSAFERLSASKFDLDGTSK